MEKNNTSLIKDIQVITAKSLEELYYYQKSIMDLEIFGSGTTREHLDHNGTGKKSIIFTRTIPDLQFIDKKERYIEIGAASNLSQIIEFGDKIIPKVLFDALKSIGNPFIKNLATIGGNICYTKKRLTLFSPLLALEARLECRASLNDSIYIPISKFSKVPKGYFLYKIRVPIDDWDISIFKKLGPQNSVDRFSAFFTFLAHIEKAILVNVRIAFCGNFSFRHKELENKLLGIRLPLSEKFRADLLLEAEKLYDESFLEYKLDSKLQPDIETKTNIETETDIEALHKQQYLNLVSYSLDYLS